MYACKSGHALVVQELIKSGIDKSATDNEGSSALVIASGYGRTNVVEILLGEGFDIDSTDKYGETSLMFACEKNYPETVELLLNKGVIRIKDENGYTALMFACQNGHEKLVTKLIDAGADKLIKNNNQCDALDIVAEMNIIIVCQCLLILLHRKKPLGAYNGYRR